jgi:hypothetical protein
MRCGDRLDELLTAYDHADCHSLEVINTHSGEMGRNGLSWLPNTWPENAMMFEARFSEGIARRGDGAHPARPAPAMHRRSRVHGLAESVWVHQRPLEGLGLDWPEHGGILDWIGL